MIELRFHGRGGQGAVVASKIFAEALFYEDKFVQSFPAFGVERRGAPVTAFTRIDDKPIRLRTNIYQPDHIVVLDPTLIDTTDVTAGLKEGGIVLINIDREPSTYTRLSGFKVATVDANLIATEYRLGSPAYPIVNTAILGALSRVTELVGIESVCKAISKSVPTKPEANSEAARKAFNQVLY